MDKQLQGVLRTYYVARFLFNEYDFKEDPEEFVVYFEKPDGGTISSCTKKTAIEKFDYFILKPFTLSSTIRSLNSYVKLHERTIQQCKYEES